MLGRLTLPCDYSTAERALVLLAGPPDEMDRKGVEKAEAGSKRTLRVLRCGVGFTR